jgi:cytochrome c oxidase cbb3-type subunit III
MSVRQLALGVTGLMAFGLWGCANSPGRPTLESEKINPDAITDYATLYGENCAGCHGTAGKGGAALALGDPVYLAIADDAAMKHAATNGVSGTLMPAFAKSKGGMLTDKQIDIIVQGLRKQSSNPDALRGANPPPYSSTTPGNASTGANIFATYCSSCHGPAGGGGQKAGSIVDGSFLSLMSDQELRTIVIVGRPELGAPDWRGNVPGKPMSAQDVSDVVAWLVSQRSKYPGQPYSTEKSTGETR